MGGLIVTYIILKLTDVEKLVKAKIYCLFTYC